MTLLKQPSEINETVLVKGLVYGQPGIGKSTLALSAPNPVMIDADMGMRRVEKRFQAPSLPLESYEKVLELFQSNELDGFQTIVFDTLGKLVDRIGDYLVRTNPKAKQSDGSLSMKGWGYLKIEFQKLLKMADAKNKHLIFVAHEREERDGDTRIIRPDVSGSSGKDILKELDFMGYMEMRGDKRTISFTPCEKFYAKNSLRLPGAIEIPSTENAANEFIQRVIIDKTVERLKEDEETAKSYNAMISDFTKQIEKIETPEDADKMLEALSGAEGIWDAVRVLKGVLNRHTKDVGLAYNKDSKSFEVSDAKEETKTESDEPGADADETKAESTEAETSTDERPEETPEKEAEAA